MGYVTSMDLLVHENSSPLLSIVRACEVVVKESDEYDDAILAMREKGLTYAPVVDAQHVVVRCLPACPCVSVCLSASLCPSVSQPI